KGGDDQHALINWPCVGASPQPVRRPWQRGGREHGRNAQGEYQSEGNHRPGEDRSGEREGTLVMASSKGDTGNRLRPVTKARGGLRAPTSSAGSAPASKTRSSVAARVALRLPVDRAASEPPGPRPLVFAWDWLAHLCQEEGVPCVLGHALSILSLKAIHSG